MKGFDKGTEDSLVIIAAAANEGVDGSRSPVRNLLGDCGLTRTLVPHDSILLVSAGKDSALNHLRYGRTLHEVGWAGNGSWLEGGINLFLPLFLVPVRVSSIANDGANNRSAPDLPPTYSISKNLESSIDSGCLPGSVQKMPRAGTLGISMASSTFHVSILAICIIAVPVLAVCIIVVSTPAAPKGRRLRRRCETRTDVGL